jgi:predicted O-methyltransferase YrrM
MSATLADVLRDAPALHGPADADALLTHGLLEEALAFIDRTVRDGDRTLETGSGYSTILFALRGAHHTCITPSRPEIDRIRAYCEQHGIATDRVDFRAQPSERVLPGLELEALDLVLIDGSHSFPQVFLDWFHTASALRVGGHLIVDDVHVWTGRVLRDFLVAEPEWQLRDELGGRTAILRKAAQTDPDRLWSEQPYVVRHSHLGVRMMARQSLSMLRHGHGNDLARRARGVVRDRLRRA